MNMNKTNYDVIVVGAGNAALCAAMAAQEQGAKVLVLERAPREDRGGNGAYSAGGFRMVYHGLEDVKKFVDLTAEQIATTDFENYTSEKYLADLHRVTENRIDPELAKLLVLRSTDTVLWLRKKGMQFVPRYGSQAHKHDGRYKFFGGLVVGTDGGASLMNSEFDAAEKQGVAIRYNARAIALLHGTAGVEGIRIVNEPGGGEEEIHARAVVLACGGFEANPEWRKRHLGTAWEVAKVRGTRYNTGDGLKMALEIGAQPFGDWAGAHACEWDINAPEFGNLAIGEGYSKHSYPYSIMLNANGVRFLDEGADIRNFTYAKYGRVIMEQPGHFCWQVFDSKVVQLLRSSYRRKEATKVTANTLDELIDRLGNVNKAQALRTISEFNAAVRKEMPFDPNKKDGRGTTGLAIPKSNWAQAIDTPPYDAYGVTGGISFTFGGLKITTEGQVIDTKEKPIAGLYAAGELVGGIFYQNYPGGAGLTCSAVFGKLAGEHAGRCAVRR